MPLSCPTVSSAGMPEGSSSGASLSSASISAAASSVCSSSTTPSVSSGTSSVNVSSCRGACSSAGASFVGASSSGPAGAASCSSAVSSESGSPNASALSESSSAIAAAVAVTASVSAAQTGVMAAAHTQVASTKVISFFFIMAISFLCPNVKGNGCWYNTLLSMIPSTEAFRSPTGTCPVFNHPHSFRRTAKDGTPASQLVHIFFFCQTSLPSKYGF